MAAESLNSPVRHRRSPKAILASVTRPQNYSSVLKTFQSCDRPVDFLLRYVMNGGEYPARIVLQTPIGPVGVNTYSPDDIQTINEIFFRGDYESEKAAEVVVDFGSNIGISATYFLTRNPRAFVYCHEPLPKNIERLRDNLAPFEGRFQLAEVAVGEAAGTVRFGWEPTGRYGGVGRDTGSWIDVECIDSNAVLRDVIAKHGRIDLLKIDIETLEKTVTERITPDLAARIGTIVVEFPFAENPLATTHQMVRNNYVTSFVPIADAA